MIFICFNSSSSIFDKAGSSSLGVTIGSAFLIFSLFVFVFAFGSAGFFTGVSFFGASFGASGSTFGFKEFSNCCSSFTGFLGALFLFLKERTFFISNLLPISYH
jgi:hypothetical protein